MATTKLQLLVLTIFMFFTHVVRGGCPGGWAQWSDHCYLLQPTPVEQSAAVALCGMYNATLVSVASSQETSALEKLMTAAVSGTGLGVKYWTGLSVAGQSTYSWTDHTVFNKSVVSILPPSASILRAGRTCASWDSAMKVIRFEACDSHYRPFCKRSAALDFIDKCYVEDGWQDISGACYKLFDVTSSWSDAQQQCLRNDANLFIPGTSPYVIDKLVSCRISVSHIWLGVSDTAHAGTLMTTNNTAPAVNWAPGDNTIIEPGNTCAEVVTTTSNMLRYQTDICDHEKQFICHKPYGTCPEGWVEYNGRCYQLQTSPKAATTWYLAKQTCADQGASLLILNSMDEHLFITRSIGRQKVPVIWLGFSDEVTPDVLVWVDGTPANGTGVFDVWAPNFPYPLPNRVDCGQLHVGSPKGSWDHGYCYNARSYVCELPIGKPLSPKPTTWANYTCDSDDGWTVFRDQCFLFSEGQNSWDNASQICTAQGGHLAIVNDKYVQSFLRLTLPDTGHAWIGLKMDRNDNKYYWPDHTEAIFTNYLPGKPDKADQGYYCIEMAVDNSLDSPGGWYDFNCSTPQDYICQKPAVQTGAPSPSPTYAWSVRCEPGWRLNSLDDFCYLVMTDTPKTWEAASYDCQRRGADLLSISGPNEQLHIEAVLSTAYPQFQDLWIGASDSTHEGGWEWSDTSPFRYLHWHPGEPNDMNKGEDCAELVGHWNYQWNDRHCDDKLNYICKKQAKPPATNPTPAVPTLPPATKCEMGPVVSGLYSVQSTFAFTASSTLDINHTAADSRLLDYNTRSWKPSKDRPGEWVGLTFYQTMAFDSMTVAGEPDSFSFVTSFKVQYQYNIHSPWYWIESGPGVTMVFDGPEDDDSSAVAFFPSVIHAQSVRIYPQAWGTHIGVRWELNGCVMEACSSDYAISGPLVVMEEAFTASSMSDPTHTPHDSRLHPVSQDTPPSCWRAGDAFDPTNPPWIEVDLGTIKLMRGVTVVGNPDADEYVTLFQLQYRLSDGSNTFIPYQEPYGIPMNFTGNEDHNSSVTTLLKSIIPAQHVRLVVLTYHGYPALRFDVLVCSLATCKDMPLLSGKHNVSDSAFSASSSLDPQHGPGRSRLGEQFSGASGGAWVAKFNDAHQYLQVDLGEKIQVWAVATQGSDALKEWVGSYTLAFSQDGKIFSSYSADGKHAMVFDGNFDATSVRKHYLDIATLARYVQLWPMDYRDGIALRWEIYGCPGPDSGEYVGCYLDQQSQLDLPFEPLIDPYAHIGPISCRYHCYDRGYAYAGLQRGIACYCGNSFGKYGGSITACTASCLPPYEREKCGGHLANSIYTTGITPPNEYCNVGWIDKGKNCYMVLEELRSWFDGHEMCRQQGAELVSIGSEVENDFVFSLLNSLTTQGKYGSAWVGLNDVHESYFYQWNDGSEVTYTNWDLNMPVTDPTQEQHCVALNNNTGGWRTVFCEDRMMYICKMPKQPSPIPHLPPITEGCEKVGWSAFKGSCYNLVDEKQAWADAQRGCKTSGATLVRINDRYEQAFVSSLLGSSTGFCWSDVSVAQEQKSFTFSDKSPVTFAYWGPRQPSPKFACVGLYSGQHAGLWYTMNCTFPHHAICEKPIAGYTPIPTQPLVPPSARCPEEWFETKYSCYQVNTKSSKQRLSWDEAREDCRSQGADLASIHALEDLESVWKNSLAGSDGNFWIGLRYSHQDESMKWSDGSGVNFLQWAVGESEALQGLKNCGEIRVDSGDMAHQSCFSLRNWVCSIARGSVPQPRTTVIVPTAGISGSCSPLDDRWKLYGKSCYTVVEGDGDTAKTWREARDWCFNMQASLVSITTRMEQLFVQSLIQNTSSLALWIGLNKLNFGHGFQWSDGSPVAYENWDVGEPNNFGFLENCVDILPRNGKWNDDVCTRKQGFVCEQIVNFTIPSTTTTPAPTGFCPPGYRAFGNKCLRVFGSSEGEQLLDWSRAWNFCTAFGPGYTLASIGSVAENLFVITLLGDNQLSAWFGLRRLGDGSFAWTDNAEITFTNWDDGEPSGGVQSCVYMKGSSSNAGLWNDAPCGQQANYICQTNKSPSISTPEPIPNPCDAKIGFKPFRAGCYKYVAAAANWTTATQACNKLGADLSTINNAFSQAFLQLFVADGAGVSVGSDDVPFVWIGLSDWKTKGVYVWNLGWPITFSNWAPEEPSRGDGEGCVRMDSDGHWVDDDCSQTLPYVCAIINENYTTFTPKPPTGQCVGHNWVAYGDFCYLFKGDDRQTFYESQLRCREQEARLISIHDNTTVEFLVNMVISQTSYNVWLGLYGSQTAGFSWLDHSAVEYTNWADSEPSGTNQEDVPEHCVGMDPRTKLWDDLDCDLHLGYICRKAQEIDNSLVTRPPVIGPQNSPPAISQVPQKTPGTLIPPVRQSTMTPKISTLTPKPPLWPQTPTTTRHLSPGSANSQGGVFPTAEGQTGSSNGLSSAAIAGIVITIIVLLAVGGAAAFLYVRQRQGWLYENMDDTPSFSNILFNDRAAASIGRSSGAKTEDDTLGEICISGATASTSQSEEEVTVKGATEKGEGSEA
ncbi:lymphocyte antigen 75-like [Littorina saxatilis]|uniref:Macrophage mannose receptor 1-like n=1 Tax=Littorina saxatilis TaxID=31220 RepID=A0AAN9B0X0_9CAEN